MNWIARPVWCLVAGLHEHSDEIGSIKAELLEQLNNSQL